MRTAVKRPITNKLTGKTAPRGVSAVPVIEGGQSEPLQALSKSRFSNNAAVSTIVNLREGIPATEWKSTSDALGIPSEHLISLLDVKRSTIKRDEKNGARLSALTSDKLYRVTQVLNKAIRVFEDESSAKTWLQTAQMTLGGVIPLSLLDTTLGYEMVGDALERIQAGVVA
jgi:putative toxin-antitoxin system antitoxin component (TIGR02293 family)